MHACTDFITQNAMQKNLLLIAMLPVKIIPLNVLYISAFFSSAFCILTVALDPRTTIDAEFKSFATRKYNVVTMVMVYFQQSSLFSSAKTVFQILNWSALYGDRSFVLNSTQNKAQYCFTTHSRITLVLHW